jgi:D-tyrosyl-tRNA(Tyr) deacylase
MTTVNVQFGGGFVSPKLSDHLKRVQASNDSIKPQTGFGGGLVAPKPNAHLASTEFGSGVIYPKLAKHIAG